MVTPAGGPSPSGSPITVALDGNGADRGPEVIVAGARAAAGDGIRVRVFGAAEELRDLAGVDGVEVHGAPEAITNREEPVRAVRSKPEASVVLAADDVAAGPADALVSAGSTGATMAAATFALRRLAGVHRPALALELRIPGRSHPVLLLDCGASAEARPPHLVQFAYLGAAFSEAVLGVDGPCVALLSVGEEGEKGPPKVVEAHRLLSEAKGIRFIGNAEGNDLLHGDADVVVTDGFTGNVVLKTIEGTAKAVADAVRGAARSSPRAALGGLLLRRALGGLRRDLDPDTTGGAILLGLRSVAVVAHGSSGPDGVANAIRLAARSVSERAVDRTAALLERGDARRSGLRKVGVT